MIFHLRIFPDQIGKTVADRCPVDFDDIADGGIRTASDATEFILAGASAVTIGTASFVQPNCAIKVIGGIEKYCERHRISKVSELIGSLE